MRKSCDIENSLRSTEKLFYQENSQCSRCTVIYGTVQFPNCKVKEYEIISYLLFPTRLTDLICFPVSCIEIQDPLSFRSNTQNSSNLADFCLITMS